MASFADSAQTGEAATRKDEARDGSLGGPVPLPPAIHVQIEKLTRKFCPSNNGEHAKSEQENKYATEYSREPKSEGSSYGPHADVKVFHSSDLWQGSTVKFANGPDECGFQVIVGPYHDLWINSPVHFFVTLPEGFPKSRPQVRCTHIDETLRSDNRLLMLVEPQPSSAGPSPTSSDDDESLEDDDVGEQPKLYKSRIEKDGIVHTNLFESQYMGWLEFYSLEVIVYTLRSLFAKPEIELAPASERYVRAKPSPVLVESGVYEEQGPRQTMEDRVCVEDFRFVGEIAAELYADGSLELSGDDLLAEKKKSPAYHSRTSSTGANSDGSTNSSGSSLKQHAAVGVASDDCENRLESSFDKTRPALGVDSAFLNLSLQDDTSKAAVLQGRKISLHAVFDGHGGYHAADQASLIFEELFFAKLTKDPKLGIRRALYDSVLGTEKRLMSMAAAERKRTGYVINTSGTTLCAVAVDLDQGVLHCANVGDSRAVLFRRGGVAVDLSVDHKASRPDEVARVVQTGGFVSYGRVLSMLAVSRALGDPEMKSPNPLISAVPHITSVELQKTDLFFLIACDGVFDVLTSQKAADFVQKRLHATQGSAEDSCVDIVKHALGPLGSVDNVSAIVAKFDHQPPPSTLDCLDPDGVENGVEEGLLLDYALNYPTTDEDQNTFLSPTVQAAMRASRMRKKSFSQGSSG